jgi:hypothetical protein
MGVFGQHKVNYYHYQLMYDYPPDWRFLVQERKLKRSSLNRALERLNRTLSERPRCIPDWLFRGSGDVV